MDKESIIIDSSNSRIGAVIYIDSEKWEDGKEKYRWDIVKQKNGIITDTVEVNYAGSIGQAVANAIYTIKQRRNKKQWKKDR